VYLPNAVASHIRKQCFVDFVMQKFQQKQKLQLEKCAKDICSTMKYSVVN